MKASLHRISATALLAIAAPVHAQDIVVPSGQTLVYDTTAGPLRVDNLIIEAGGILHARGPESLRILARRAIVIDGLLDISGRDAAGVLTLNTANIPELGSEAGPAGGRGGLGSRFTSQSTPDGYPGFGTGRQLRGGHGGETGFDPGTKNARRGAGGGGGALAPDQPVSGDPDAPENIGLVAQDGFDGSDTGLGAISMVAPPRGGLAGARPFVDASSENDFFGRRRLAGGAILVGELGAPIGGRGGGAGGDAVHSATFPGLPFTPAGDEKGAGGGGGGGLGILVAPQVRIGAQGAVRADGGDGGGGENTLFFDHVGGGSGAGSGGFVLIQARVIDLRAAGADAISALGGQGGRGMDHDHGVFGAGGNGGPGLIQLHVPRGAQDILLAPGVSLDDLTTPGAHVLLPEAGL